MAISLDTTAHPANAPITATQDHVTSGSTSATGTFSTGGANRVAVAALFADGGNAVWPATFAGGGLTWTLRPSAISTTFLNDSGAAIYTAYASGTLTNQTLTATFANAATGGATHITDICLFWLVNSGTAFSGDSAVIGANATAVNESTTATMNLTITPTGTGSWLFGMWTHTNDGVTPTADANTTPFDSSFAPTGSDRAVFGRYKTSGAVATTTASTPVTFGCSTSNTFYYMVALEIMVPSGGSALTGTQAETATPSDAYAAAQAMVASEAESTTVSDTYSTAQAMLTTEAESASPTDTYAPGLIMPASESESATASAAFASGMALATQQAESTAGDVLFACSMVMGASQSEGTSPLVLFDDGTTPGRHTQVPFYPWWYRLQPLNRRRIM